MGRRKTINLQKENNISCLPFKKRWLKITATNSNNYNELQLLTDKDIKRLDSLNQKHSLPRRLKQSKEKEENSEI